VEGQEGQEKQGLRTSGVDRVVQPMTSTTFALETEEVDMTKLISTVAAVVFAMSTAAAAAPGQGAMGKAAEKASAKADKPAKTDTAGKGKYKATTGHKTANKAQKRAAKADFKDDKRDLKADQQELKRLRADLKAAQKAGDWQRVSRDRRAIYRLEAEIRADKADLKDDKREAKSVAKNRRTPLRPWWR
jgi:hypothetical protein